MAQSPVIIPQDIDSGDVVLFHGERPPEDALSRILRGLHVISSEWDHVGVVVVDESGKKLVFEILPDGTHMTPLPQRLSQSKASEIGIKRVNIERTYEMRKRAFDYSRSVAAYKYENKTSVILNSLIELPSQSRRQKIGLKLNKMMESLKELRVHLQFHPPHTVFSEAFIVCQYESLWREATALQSEFNAFKGSPFENRASHRRRLYPAKLVASVLMEMHLLGKYPVPDEYAVTWFQDSSCFEFPMRMNAFFEPTQIIKSPDASRLREKSNPTQPLPAAPEDIKRLDNYLSKLALLYDTSRRDRQLIINQALLYTQPIGTIIHIPSRTTLLLVGGSICGNIYDFKGFGEITTNLYLQGHILRKDSSRLHKLYRRLWTWSARMLPQDQKYRFMYSYYGHIHYVPLFLRHIIDHILYPRDMVGAHPHASLGQHYRAMKDVRYWLFPDTALQSASSRTPLAPVEKLHALNMLKSSLFGEFITTSAFPWLYSQIDSREFRDKTIVKKGDYLPYILILKKGTIVREDGESREVLPPGSIIGGVRSVYHFPSSSDYTVEGSASILSIDRNSILSHYQGDPNMSLYVTRCLSSQSGRENLYKVLHDCLKTDSELNMFWLLGPMWRLLLKYLFGVHLSDVQTRAVPLSNTFVYDNKSGLFKMRPIRAHNVNLMPDVNRQWHFPVKGPRSRLYGRLKHLLTAFVHKPSAHFSLLEELLFKDLSVKRSIILTRIFLSDHSKEYLYQLLSEDPRFLELQRAHEARGELDSFHRDISNDLSLIAFCLGSTKPSVIRSGGPSLVGVNEVGGVRLSTDFAVKLLCCGASAMLVHGALFRGGLAVAALYGCLIGSETFAFHLFSGQIAAHSPLKVMSVGGLTGLLLVPLLYHFAQRDLHLPRAASPAVASLPQSLLRRALRTLRVPPSFILGSVLAYAAFPLIYTYLVDTPRKNPIDYCTGSLVSAALSSGLGALVAYGSLWRGTVSVPRGSGRLLQAVRVAGRCSLRRMLLPVATAATYWAYMQSRPLLAPQGPSILRQWTWTHFQNQH